MRRRREVVASDPRLAEPMLEALRAGGAADAVACGLFVAAALDASVLLGPAQILVGGVGSGRRAIDGRARQPGLGTKRPRGYKPGDRIPAAARVAVPGLPAAALLLHASAGRAPASAIEAIVAPIARAASRARARVLGVVLGGGAAALAKEKALLDAAGPVAGGLLTRDDLESLRPATEPCAEDGGVARAPWPRGPSREVEILAASDSRGGAVVACYERSEEGLRIDALDLAAPLVAVPVRRGVTRTAPGEPLPAPAPIALVALGRAQTAAAGARAETALAAALEGVAKGTSPKGIFVARA